MAPRPSLSHLRCHRDAIQGLIKRAIGQVFDPGTICILGGWGARGRGVRHSRGADGNMMYGRQVAHPGCA